MPKSMAGRSLQLRQLPSRRHNPLLRPQSRMALLLISTCPGFSLRKPSSQSKVPSSGRQTGNNTSRTPFVATAGGFGTSASAAAASWIMRTVNGRGAIGSGPKFTCRVMFL